MSIPQSGGGLIEDERQLAEYMESGSKTADLWRGRLIVAEEECTRLNKVEWTYEVQDTPTVRQYAWVALGVVVAVCSIPFIVEAIVWFASVWGL